MGTKISLDFGLHFSMTFWSPLIELMSKVAVWKKNGGHKRMQGQLHWSRYLCAQGMIWSYSHHSDRRHCLGTRGTLHLNVVTPRKGQGPKAHSREEMGEEAAPLPAQATEALNALLRATHGCLSFLLFLYFTKINADVAMRSLFEKLGSPTSQMATPTWKTCKFQLSFEPDCPVNLLPYSCHKCCGFKRREKIRIDPNWTSAVWSSGFCADQGQKQLTPP